MTQLERDLQELVDRFVSDVVTLAQQQARATLQSALGSSVAKAPQSAPSLKGPKSTKVKREDRQQFDAAAVSHRVLQLLSEPNERLGRVAISHALEIDVEQTSVVLKQLVETEQIIRRGHGRGTWYEAIARHERVDTAIDARAAEDAFVLAPSEPGSTKRTSGKAAKPRKTRGKGPSVSEIEKLVAEGLARRVATSTSDTPASS